MRSLSASCSRSATNPSVFQMHHSPDPERSKTKGIISSFGRVDETVGVSKTFGQIIRSLLVSAALLSARVT